MRDDPISFEPDLERRIEGDWDRRVTTAQQQEEARGRCDHGGKDQGEPGEPKNSVEPARAGTG